jgi:hypothetical protein
METALCEAWEMLKICGKPPRSLQKATKTYQLSSFEKCSSLLQQHL